MRRRKLDDLDNDADLRFMRRNWNLHSDGDRDFAKPCTIVQHKAAAGGYPIGWKFNSPKLTVRRRTRTTLLCERRGLGSHLLDLPEIQRQAARE